MDLLATVASFPNPDDKIRSTSMKVNYLGDPFVALEFKVYIGIANA